MRRSKRRAFIDKALPKSTQIKRLRRGFDWRLVLIAFLHAGIPSGGHVTFKKELVTVTNYFAKKVTLTVTIKKKKTTVTVTFVHAAKPKNHYQLLTCAPWCMPGPDLPIG